MVGAGTVGFACTGIAGVWPRLASASAALILPTLILANRIEIKEATLIVNADYASSDVPVPDGVGPNTTTISLEH